ncbi:MAG: nucleoside deaminase [Chloroflexota bacterium]|nr:nucleoside deaminase [Chloroflexota bacterium]
MPDHDEDFLRQAIGHAVTARQQGEFPFGAILVIDQQIVHQAADHCLSYADPTAHAELLVISEYCRQQLTLNLDGYTLYSSAEPCVMCAGAIKWSRISRVVFSVSQAMLQAINGGRPKPACADLVNTGGRAHAVDGPLLPEEGLAVFAGFDFKPKRSRHYSSIQNV